MKALLLQGRSAYEATRLFIEEVAAAFRRAGDEAIVADLAEHASDPLEPLGAYRDEGVDLIFSIGLFGECRDRSGQTAAQVLGAPHVVQYVDYPPSHYPRLNATPAETALLTVDPTHVDAVLAIYGRERFKHVAFSPHGAVGDACRVDPDPQSYLAARPIPVLFPGTFYKPGPPLWANLPRKMTVVFEAAVEIALAAEFRPALDAFDQALELRGGALTAQEQAALRRNAFAVHEHVRQHRRFKMLQALARAGVPVHVYGAGYDRDLYRFKNITFLGDADLRTVLSAMRRSRVVLNVNANFGRGSHERPLSAMLAGAVAVTDHSEFYVQAFAQDEIVQLRWTALDDDLARLKGHLEDGPWLRRIADAGNARATREHRWDDRLETIKAAAEAVR